MKKTIFQHALEIRELDVLYEESGLNINEFSPKQIVKDAENRLDIISNWDEYDSEPRYIASQIRRLENFILKWSKEV